nr:DUF86 domain-containing protein [uncultured Dyadobacter sp.]
MSERQSSVLFLDMLEAVEAVLDYTAGMNFETFLNDRKTRDAVIRNLQVLGEAGNRIPKTIRDGYPEIEWMRIIRSRHILVHDYAGIDFEIVWRIIEVHLPPLKEVLEDILNRSK